MKKLFVLMFIMALLLSPMSQVAFAQPVAAGEITHIVQPGQTLFSIARWYGVDVWTLARANNIVNPNRIYVGQRLVIPASSTTPPASNVYVVKPGDTLYSIARVYRTTAWAIARANGIYNLNHIYVGQRLIIPGVAPAPTPTPAPPSPPAATGQWRGAYYNNPDLEGEPAFVRNDAGVNFHWGLRSPDTRLNTDHFSVHWTRTINFLGGLYRFTMTVDDGVRIWVDDQLVLDQWEVQPETTYPVEVALTRGNHLITIAYFEDTGNATAQFSFVRLGVAPVTSPATPPSTAPTGAWHGEYFGNTDLSGAPVFTREDSDIGFDWGLGSPALNVPADYFSVRWTRKITFDKGRYAFCAMADDGVRLYVGGARLIDEWHPSNGLSYCATTELTKGAHEVKVEYYEDGGQALIYVWWEKR